MCGWVKHLKQGQAYVISCPKQPSDRSPRLGAEEGALPCSHMQQRGTHKGSQEVSVAKLNCSGNEGGVLKEEEAPLVQLSRVL